MERGGSKWHPSRPWTTSVICHTLRAHDIGHKTFRLMRALFLVAKSATVRPDGGPSAGEPRARGPEWRVRRGFPEEMARGYCPRRRRYPEIEVICLPLNGGRMVASAPKGNSTPRQSAAFARAF